MHRGVAKTMLAALALLSAVGLSESAPLHKGLSLDVTSDGAYTVWLGGAAWFRSAATFYTSQSKTLSSADGSLPLDSLTTGDGMDASGHYTSSTLSWDGGRFLTSFREYDGVIVFTQTFPKGVEGTALNATNPMAGRDHVSTGFPSFAASSYPADRGYLAFAGWHSGSAFQHGTGALNATYQQDGVPYDLFGVNGFGPVCHFSADLSESVVISSFSQFMVASAAMRGDSVAYGLQGSVTSLPPGYSLSYAIVASPAGGVNRAFENWGDVLLGRYGKSRTATYSSDYALQYLGYSTDNGAFYYYQTEGHAPQRGPPYTPGKTYEETLIDVKKYADAEQIPYKYILLDSWWYFQGVGGGVTNWVGRPDVFPHGNDYVRNATGWPIVGHNRYWAVDNSYATANGGSYDFIVERKADNPQFKDFAWPTEQRFWDDLLYNASKWGLHTYEQDWLLTEYDSVVHLNTNATAGRTWLHQMAAAAARNDLTIQYCMAYPRHIMQSVEFSAVTNARASVDYHAGHADQWQQLGGTGMFTWALGIAPTKDNFWSTDVQTGSAYDDHNTISEPYNRLQAAVSTLSKGPVAPSDKIGRSDASLILKSCAADGRLLQGDKPAMLIDSLHMARAFKTIDCSHSEIWATYTVLSSRRFAVTLVANLTLDYQLDLGSDLGLEGAYVSYEANATDRLTRSPKIRLEKCGLWDFGLWASAPVLPNGWTLLGETNKWVPVSNSRFRDLTASHSGANSACSVTAIGTPGEHISVTWLAPGATEPLVLVCVVGPGGVVIARVMRDGHATPSGACV